MRRYNKFTIKDIVVIAACISIIFVQCLKGLHPNSISAQIFLIINKQHIIVFAEEGGLL